MTLTPKQDNLTSETFADTETKPLNLSPQKSITVFLKQAGQLKDDSSLADLREAIYQARGRSETDDAVSS